MKTIVICITIIILALIYRDIKLNEFALDSKITMFELTHK